MAIEKRIHLFTFRTQKLSFSSSKILGWRRPGKIEHCWNIIKPTARGWFFVLVHYFAKKSAVFCKALQPCLHCRANLPVFPRKISPGLRRKGGLAKKLPLFLMNTAGMLGKSTLMQNFFKIVAFRLFASLPKNVYIFR